MRDLHFSEEARYLRWSVAVAIVAFLSFTIGIWDQAFVDFETRFALFAKEMLRHGISLFPTTYGKPYADYPVTSTLLIYLAARLFGFFNKFIAVLPTALASTGIVTLTFSLLVRRSVTWAFTAICFEWMNFTFLIEARSISLDQMVSCITLASFYVALRAEASNSKRVNYWLIALFIAGFLIRGPIGVILPAATIGSYYFINRKFKNAIAWGVIALITILLMWLLQLGIAWQQGGSNFVDDVIRMQVTERMNLEDFQPFYYYFTSSFGNYAPTFPLFVLVATVFFINRSALKSAPHYLLMLSLFGWVAIIIIGLSIPHTKKIRYLLPIIPPLCAIVAYPLAINMLPRLKQFLSILLGIFPTFLLAILLYGKRMAERKGIDVGQQLTTASWTLLVLQLTVITSAVLNRLRIYRVPIICGIAAFASWFSLTLVVEPTFTSLHDTSYFSGQAEQLRDQNPAPLAFYKIGKDGMAIKYMVNLNKDELPEFPQNENDLLRLPKPIYVIMEEKTKNKLSSSATQNAELLLTHKFDKTTLSLLYLAH